MIFWKKMLETWYFPKTFLQPPYYLSVQWAYSTGYLQPSTWYANLPCRRVSIENYKRSNLVPFDENLEKMYNQIAQQKSDWYFWVQKNLLPYTLYPLDFYWVQQNGPNLNDNSVHSFSNTLLESYCFLPRTYLYRAVRLDKPY